MDRRELELKLVDCCNACEREGYPIMIEGTSDAYPGSSNTSYFVHIRGLDWANDMSYSQMLDVIIPILYKSLEGYTIRHIFALNVYNLSQSMNCHYPMTFEEYNVAC